jgi:hypothetical protein
MCKQAQMTMANSTTGVPSKREEKIHVLYTPSLDTKVSFHLRVSFHTERERNYALAEGYNKAPRKPAWIYDSLVRCC